MTKILVADDEADLEVLIRQKFRQKIRDQEFEFVFAQNGKEALEKIRSMDDLDLVLSDINMPELDGLSLLLAISESFPLLKTVIVSAYGDMDNIRTAMNRGAFDFVTKPINFEDLDLTIQKTIQHVRQLRDTVKAIRENNILKMYVDDHVLQFMASREFEEDITASESITASVAFIDICSFTSFTEKSTPDYIVKLLNDYFDVMVKEIIDQKGHVDKFIGDCIMAVFRGDFHLDRAIDACLSIKKQMLSLPVEGDFIPNISIGINSGEMISGNIGSSTLRRLDFTVIGDAVNTAQRLQAIAAPGQILINENCFEKIKNSFQCEKIGTFQLKNKMAQQVLYEVIQ